MVPATEGSGLSPGGELSGADLASPRPAVTAGTASEQPPPSGPNLTSLPQSSPPRPIQRRSGARENPPDSLSDRATIALIRRTLCAQHVTDRDRNTPIPIEDLLPPLTSRNDVDLQLYALISIILREYVQNWYSKITPDDTFVAEVVQIIAHCTRALEQRLRKVDLESLLLDELPELLDAHVRAYRAAQNPAVRPPIEVDPREIYHSLLPVPALSPVPKAGDAKSIQAQADNEASYRQLLVQGVLALLLPTEDLENECLTALVSQVLSELIIGSLVVNKLSQPWLIWEGVISLTRLIGKNVNGAAAKKSSNDLDGREHGATKHDYNLDKHDKSGSTDIQSPNRHSNWGVPNIFWSIVQWMMLAVNLLPLLVSTAANSRTLPPRSSWVLPQLVDSIDHPNQDKVQEDVTSTLGVDAQPTPSGAPIIEFKIWPCISNILEVPVRMPWSSGALSMIQWGARWGPGRLADYNGVIDSQTGATKLFPCLINLYHPTGSSFHPALALWHRSSTFNAFRCSWDLLSAEPFEDHTKFLSYNVQAHVLGPGALPSLLRAIRGTVFPNNAPGTPTLVGPSSDQELAALRRRCASEIWALVPKGIGNVFFGAWGLPNLAAVEFKSLGVLAVPTWSRCRQAKPMNTAGATHPHDNSLRVGPIKSHSDTEDGSGTDDAIHISAEDVTSDHEYDIVDREETGKSTSRLPPAKTGERKSAPEKQSLFNSASQITNIAEPNLRDVAASHGIDCDGGDGDTSHAEGGDEERILSEIESGILDLFSDSYYNKHLIYGVIELVLVRLMPELATRGVIELWEERLS